MYPVLYYTNTRVESRVFRNNIILTFSIFELQYIVKQIFIYSDDERTVSDAKLVDGMQLHLVLTLRGG